MIFKKKKPDIEKLVHGEDDPDNTSKFIKKLKNRVIFIHYKSYFQSFIF